MEEEFQESFINQTLSSLDEVRRLERVTQTELSLRLRIDLRRTKRIFEGKNLTLGLVARVAHVLGYKCKVVFEPNERS